MNKGEQQIEEGIILLLIYSPKSSILALLALDLTPPARDTQHFTLTKGKKEQTMFEISSQHNETHQF